MVASPLGPAGDLRPSSPSSRLQRLLPFLDWLLHYRGEYLAGDVMAGIIVAIMLVPQSMAYALLAGLPPEVGLYASIVPVILYGLLGSSRTLAVGPVAIVSLLVAAGVGPLVPDGDVALYTRLALTLALLVGILQAGMGALRLGFLVNFLSHPVLVGFTGAAAIVIGFSQVKHVLGISMPQLEHFYQKVLYTAQHLGESNPVTLAIGLGSVVVLVVFKRWVPGWLERLGVPKGWRIPLAKGAPLLVVLAGTLLVASLRLDQRAGVAVVGEVPAGLPPLTLPLFDLSWWELLLPTALAISFVGYMESISVAKSLASRRRQKVDADQELRALGVANLGAALTGGYPVTGGFSRSVVNFEAGANTGLASIITAGLIALTVLLLTPLFYYLPKAVLASIILVAVAGLVDHHAIRHIWQYNKGDGLAMAVTFVAVLAISVEMGIVVGVITSLVIYIWRTSKPHMAIVGRIGKSEMYRNVLRYRVETWPQVLLIRVDESLYFANTKYLEDTVLALVADNPELRYLVLIGTAINFIDASALETLESLHHELEAAGVELHLAAIKGPVLDRLVAVGFVDLLGPHRFHFSTHDALIALGFVDPQDRDMRSPAEAAREAQLEPPLLDNRPLPSSRPAS